MKMTLLSTFWEHISKLTVIIIASFKKPMATSINSFRGFVIAILVGLLVAIIAVGLQPFGISEFINDAKTAYLIGFGIVAFSGMLIAKFVLPKILSSFYNDQQWTVARQILHLSASILIVGSLILIYGNYFHITNLSIFDVLKTVVACIFPIVAITFIQQSLFHDKFTRTAETINDGLASANPPTSKQLFPVIVFGKNEQKLSLIPNQLIYAKTSKNSTDFYWQSLMGVEKTTVQTSVAQVERELSAHPQFVRLHRNFVINMRGIHKVEGNARGYRLRIARIKHEIPVSWKFHKKLEQIGQ